MKNPTNRPFDQDNKSKFRMGDIGDNTIQNIIITIFILATVAGVVIFH